MWTSEEIPFQASESGDLKLIEYKYIKISRDPLMQIGDNTTWEKGQNRSVDLSSYFSLDEVNHIIIYDKHFDHESDTAEIQCIYGTRQSIS